jgi:hypothetical protein
MKKHDVTYTLNFQKYFSMKKDDISYDDITYLYVGRIEINDL